MFGIGSTELLVILVVALIVLGPKSLANVSRTLGKAMGEFRRVSTDFQRTLNAEAEEEEQKKRKKEAAKAARAEAEAAQAAQQTAAQAAEQPEPRAADQGTATAQDAPASEAVLDTTVVQAPSEAPQAESMPQAAPAAEAAPVAAPETDATASGVQAPPEGSPLAEALARTEAEARAAEARLTPSTPASENGGKA
ncbi:Sec-independent protein translocase protein TatB [Desulfovibrio sp.]|uniref:Sec-independent protein translocase protein TatB n=1 Tax=Desulfovibrio sp. TaxID=885 RepID=UPI0025C504B7|nr:Sec-independent protein translocase protein TatB [Desulfovibrio sp.]